MKYYFKVYLRLLDLNLANLFAYRGNFVSTLISSIAWGIFSFVFIILLTWRSPVVYGWKREELILLMALYNIVIGGFFHLFFSRSLGRISTVVHFGHLDHVLLKPIDSQFLLSSRVIAYAQISRIIMGTAATAYLVNKMQIEIGLFNFFAFIVLSAFGLLLLYSLWFLVITLTVWFSRLSNLVDLLYHLNELTRFPSKMFDPVKNYLIFIIPYTLVLVTPTRALLDKASLQEEMGLILLSILVFYLSRRFWRFALRYYTSASS